MKNLFLYAKKELSQDAFLMWLLDNFNCEDETLAQNSKKILRDFCNLNKDCKISNLNVSSQSHKIDVSIFFKANGEKHALFIEDKVFSLEHSNQLEKYNNQIKKICDERKIKESNIHKVFYKTSIVYEDEINAIEKAGWKIYSIDGINNKNSIYKLSFQLYLK